MIKKIIALVTAAFLILSFFASRVYADDTADYIEKARQQYLAAQEELLTSYLDNKITYDEYKTASDELTQDFYNDNTVDGKVASWAVSTSDKVGAASQKVGRVVGGYGNAAYDIIAGLTSDLFSDYQTTETVPMTDLNGCGALFVLNTNGSFTKIYCDYIIFYGDSVDCVGLRRKEEINKNGEIVSFKDYIDNYSPTRKVLGLSRENAKIYGDVRNKEDGTPAETDDEYGTITKYDFTQKQDPNNYDPNNPNNPDNLIPTTSRELEKLLDEFNDILDNEMPDLSTTESTLKSIFSRLGQLDSDDDNELLSKILAAVNSIKKALPDKDKDFKIDEEKSNTNGEKLKQKLLDKFSFITELKDFVTYIFDVYKKSSEIPEISFEIYEQTYKVNVDIFGDSLVLIQSILAAFIYISYGYHTYRKIPSYINGGDNE